ncbi:DUF3418 domain-containing protein, partial [Mycobacterium sp. NAZ190054]|uniref:DUF3418 domain-containing protein n=1 Tax=Mycobacterium sp. NAZ190054 TaxID=1747766 RepID=UPI000795991C
AWPTLGLTLPEVLPEKLAGIKRISRRALSPARAAAPDVEDIARMIEELRVSLWAQQLGTARPVSEQRIYRAIDAVSVAGPGG